MQEDVRWRKRTAHGASEIELDFCGTRRPDTPGDPHPARARGGSVGDPARPFDISLPANSRHLRVLERAADRAPGRRAVACLPPTGSNAIGISGKGGSTILPRRSGTRHPRAEDDGCTRHIRPYAFAPDSRDPFGRVPGFREGEFTLYETSAIVHHIEQSFRGPSLLARNARPRPTREQWASARGAPDRASSTLRCGDQIPA
jgi:hypothetical protein